MIIDNAVILAAGFSRRFAPISLVRPKALLPVKGEVLIERQIRQLKEAGISQIYVVTGYKEEMFQYLTDKWDIHLISNPEYQNRNNHSSIYYARHILGNSYICSSDNYFPKNPFTAEAERPFYSALYADGPTEEYCLTTDQAGRITKVVIGGSNSWYMLGHVLWDTAFSQRFLKILEKEYSLPQTSGLLWEKIYMSHISDLVLYQNSCPPGSILEFDSLEDLQAFDPFYSKKSTEEIISFLKSI